MRVLVIGSGAREHAIVLALAQDPGVTALACAPGNAGTAAVSEQHGVDVTDRGAVTALAQRWTADLVVIGPEVPLVAGVADAVRGRGHRLLRPQRRRRAHRGLQGVRQGRDGGGGCPHGDAEIVDNPARLDAALARFAPPYVVKDDGLAAGKGVVVTTDLDAARAHACTLLDGGHPVLLEAYLDGPEVSLFCLVDGATVVPLLPAQDFKRVGDGDRGPNTGGMGAYAPLPWAPPGLAKELVADVVAPVAAELARRGTPVLRAAVRGAGAHVGRARGGGVQLPVRRPGDPGRPRPAAHPARRASCTPPPSGSSPPSRRSPGPTGAAVTVVVAAEGYPGPPRLGDVITGAEADGVLHAGTRRRDDGAVVSAGGRVLSVVGTGDDLAAARADAYRRLDGVHLRGLAPPHRHRRARRRGRGRGTRTRVMAATSA